jgi:hypothetical protein
MSVKMEYHGVSNSRFEAVIEPRLVIPGKKVPAANLSLCIAVAQFQRGGHEVVIVGRDVNRRWQVGQHAVRFAAV